MNLSILKDVIVPLASAMLGGLLGMLGGLLVVNRSEMFRKLARWEPYSKELWTRQMELCCKILTVSNNALGAATQCFGVFNTNKDTQETSASMLHQHLSELGRLKGERLAICTPNLNQSVEILSMQLLVILQQSEEGKLNQKLSGNLPQLWFNLVDDVRVELRVEKLDAKAREALEKASNTSSFSPSGNSTLPD